MKNKKVLTAIFCVLYYLILGVLSLFIFAASIFDGVIDCFSESLFIVCVFVIPLLFIFLPLIFNKCLKKEWHKAFLYSFVANVTYVIIILPFIRFGITGYMKSFSVNKWDNYHNLRYLMVDDLDRNYKLIGKKTDSVKKLLGKPDGSFDSNKSMCYFVKSKWIDSYYYCFEYNENNVITGSFKTYRD